MVSPARRDAQPDLAFSHGGERWNLGAGVQRLQAVKVEIEEEEGSGDESDEVSWMERDPERAAIWDNCLKSARMLVAVDPANRKLRKAVKEEKAVEKALAMFATRLEAWDIE